MLRFGSPGEWDMAKYFPVVEAFLLFSQSIPSQNLGFVDSKASELEITIGDRDLIIRQSPTILSSNRGGGTTGAGMSCHHA